MKLIVEIPDNEAAFGMRVLKSLAFVTKAKPMSAAAVGLWDELKEAAEQVRLHKQGKLKLKTAQDLLDNTTLFPSSKGKKVAIRGGC